MLEGYLHSKCSHTSKLRVLHLLVPGKMGQEVKTVEEGGEWILAWPECGENSFICTGMLTMQATWRLRWQLLIIASYHNDVNEFSVHLTFFRYLWSAVVSWCWSVLSSKMVEGLTVWTIQEWTKASTVWHPGQDHVAKCKEGCYPWGIISSFVWY